LFNPIGASARFLIPGMDQPVNLVLGDGNAGLSRWRESLAQPEVGRGDRHIQIVQRGTVEVPGLGVLDEALTAGA
jgi:hypothetical protein